MLIKKVPINFINNTPLSISIYQAGKTIPHMHNDILEIIYCLKGDITITVTHEQLDFHTGDLYIINSRDVHSVESRSKEDNLIASFYINLLDPALDQESLLYDFFVCQEHVISPATELYIPFLKQHLLHLLYFYCFHPEINFYIYTKLTKQITDILIEYFPMFYFSADTTKFLPNDKERYNAILKYIRKNYKEKITMADLASIVHVSTNYLSQFFHKYLNTQQVIGISGLINFVRVFEAEKLLLTTDMNIKEISYLCGFSDPKFLYREFRNFFNRTPLEHRKWYEEYSKDATEPHIYTVGDISAEISHCIARNLASLILKD